MNNFIRGTRKKAFTSAGSLIYTGEKTAAETTISVLQVKDGKIDQKENLSVDELPGIMKEDSLVWINITGLGNIQVMQKIGEQFNIHPLILEDVLNLQHLPKSEEFYKYLFFTMKSISFSKEDEKIEENHVSLLLGDQVILSFQEKKDPVFQHVKERVMRHTMKSFGADYIFYAIVDYLVDSYYPVFEIMEENMEKLENSLIYSSEYDQVNQIIATRKNFINLKKLLSPLLKEIKNIRTIDNVLIDKKIKHYLTDVQDHVNQLNEVNNHFLDMAMSFMEINRSNLDNRLNKTMKSLTVMATIFMPLMLLTGIYGMNFHYIPGIQWKGGFFVFLVLAICIIYLMIWILRKNKWL